MKSLVIAQDFPWPISLGAHLRLDSVVRELAEFGETDLVALVPARRREPCHVPEGLAIHRVSTVTRPRPQLSLRRRVDWIINGLPLEVSVERTPEAERRLRAYPNHYDFVWVSRATTFEVFGRPRLGPTVVDIDDLEDWKILSRLRTMGRHKNGRVNSGDPSEANTAQPEALKGVAGTQNKPRRTGPTLRVAATHGVASLRDSAVVVQARLNARRWRRFQHLIAAQVERVAVCSELDLERFGVPNGIVVPNGYEAPKVPAGRDEVSAHPTLLFAGNFCYPPNSHAARWLVMDVLPKLREYIPDVQVRLVGEPDASVAELASCRSVTVVGRVPEMHPELVRADVVAVPIRYGSGTRVKILEAFANRIPVVSTTVGAEGLDIEDRRELILADDAAPFACSCAMLLKQSLTRRGLADAAQSLFLERYQWSVARNRVRNVALELTGNTTQ